LGAQAIADVATDASTFSASRPVVPDEANLATPMIPIGIDPPLHARYRNLVAPMFSPKRAAQLEDSARSVTEEVVLSLKTRKSCEFMSEFAQIIPIVVFLRFLKLPVEDRTKLLMLSVAVVKPEEGHRNDPFEKLQDYLRPFIEERSGDPGDDVISEIVTSKLDGRSLTDDEKMRLLVTILLGGLETVSSTLGYIARYLADDADARRYIAANINSSARAGIVDELLRRFPVAVVGRIATKDALFHGISIRRGDHVVWTAAMHNLDPRQCEDPARVDFARKRQAHSSFGTGVHFCLGSFIARMEIGVFLEQWLKHVPDFRVSPAARLRHHTGLTMAYKSLPLVLGVQ
jgi:camphor 5-monooxygenase